MAMQQVEFEFPDPDKVKNGRDVEVPDTTEDNADLQIEGAVGREAMKKPQKKQEVIKSGDVEIEVEDDTPAADRGRVASEPPSDVTDEELESYSGKVKKRIQHLSKGYHDERRAKETALREREALEQYAKQLIEENQKLKGAETKSHNALIESAKKQVETELNAAKRMYKDAYEAGDSDALLVAQEALNKAQIRADRVGSLKPRAQVTETPLQTDINPVQRPQQAPPRDTKAEAWRDANPWFGSDDEMTAFALGLHNKLVKDGLDPRSDEYYEKINSRMRSVFSDQFDDGVEDEPEAAPKKRPSNVVAPATRSTGPKKVRLTQSQVAIAKKLGVPVEQYALQVAQLARKS